MLDTNLEVVDVEHKKSLAASRVRSLHLYFGILVETTLHGGGVIMITKLEPLRDAHWPILQTFTLPLEQEKYTALPTDLESPLSDRIYPIVIVAEQPVGFFLLHDTERVASYTEAHDALLLSMFSINHAAQGKGHAKAALRQLPTYVHEHFPAKHEVVLSVNLKNEAAFSLYQTVGFVDTGRRIDGPIGPQRIMSLTV